MKEKNSSNPNPDKAKLATRFLKFTGSVFDDKPPGQVLTYSKGPKKRIQVELHSGTLEITMMADFPYTEDESPSVSDHLKMALEKFTDMVELPEKIEKMICERKNKQS